MKTSHPQNPQILQAEESFNLDFQSHPDLSKTSNDGDEADEEDAADGADEDVVWCQSRE